MFDPLSVKSKFMIKKKKKKCILVVMITLEIYLLKSPIKTTRVPLLYRTREVTDKVM